MEKQNVCENCIYFLVHYCMDGAKNLVKTEIGHCLNSKNKKLYRLRRDACEDFLPETEENVEKFRIRFTLSDE